MTWTTILALLKLTPAKLNIALLLLGVSGMIWAYNKGQDRIGALEERIENRERLQLIREDSINKVHQANLAICQEENNKTKERFIDFINKTGEKIEKKLTQREEEDQRKLREASVNRKMLLENNKKINKIINAKTSTPLED